MVVISQKATLLLMINEHSVYDPVHVEASNATVACHLCYIWMFIGILSVSKVMAEFEFNSCSFIRIKQGVTCPLKYTYVQVSLG